MTQRFIRYFTGLAALAALATAAGAQDAKQPPVRTLAKAHAASVELLGAVSQVRALPDGRVLVNDNLGRKVAMYDKSLANPVVVADTTSATANAYSSRAGGLIPYRGDSTLFVDPQSLSMLVIDPKGQVTRVMSVPRPNEAQSLIGGPNGTPGFDAQGRLVYRGAMNISFGGRGGMPAPGSGPIPTPTFPDSVPVVRINLETRAVDTVTFVKIAAPKMTMTQSASGSISMSSITNPMPIVDDWAVASDGRVAVLRGREYRIDWIDGSGQVVGSAKVPFNWRHMDDSAKVAFIDSTRVVMEELRKQQQARMQANGAGGPVMMGPGDGGGGGAPMVMMKIEMGARDGGGNPPPRGQQNGAAPKVELPPIQFVPASELPDYAPAFSAGAARADVEGNIWVRTTNSQNGGAVYDVINPKGELIDRVAIPAGRVVAGFGPGTVYMGVREGTGVRLEAAHTARTVTP